MNPYPLLEPKSKSSPSFLQSIAASEQEEPVLSEEAPEDLIVAVDATEL